MASGASAVGAHYSIGPARRGLCVVSEGDRSSLSQQPLLCWLRYCRFVLSRASERATRSQQNPSAPKIIDKYTRVLFFILSTVRRQKHEIFNYVGLSFWSELSEYTSEWKDFVG